MYNFKWEVSIKIVCENWEIKQVKNERDWYEMRE